MAGEALAGPAWLSSYRMYTCTYETETRRMEKGTKLHARGEESRHVHVGRSMVLLGMAISVGT